MTEMGKRQEEDEDIGPVLAMVRENKPRPSWEEVAHWNPDSKTLWQSWDRLQVRNGILCREFEYFNGKLSVWQAIVPYRLREGVFAAVHGGVTGGHMGRKRTED